MVLISLCVYIKYINSKTNSIIFNRKRHVQYVIEKDMSINKIMYDGISMTGDISDKNFWHHVLTLLTWRCPEHIDSIYSILQNLVKIRVSDGSDSFWRSELSKKGSRRQKLNVRVCILGLHPASYGWSA